MKKKKKKCEWCGKLVEKKEWKDGLCSKCRVEYMNMTSIMSQYQN